ncbi:MAG: saccharopine dehydrogenase NADP-binding domain-containing protein [Pseudomonadota bacterium]
MEPTRPYRVLVIGGYGFFGRRVVQRLSRHAGFDIVVAGRSATPGEALVQSLRPTASAKLSHTVLDIHAPGLVDGLRHLGPDAVVHASGPFQGQGYGVARACLAAGAHCIDLADGREFVAGVGRLDAEARAAGLAVVSGASSVPALSGAAADHLASGLAQVDEIDIGISPGNRTERGLSTVQAILGYCGRPRPGAPGRHGWSGTRHHDYPPPVGRRLLSPCDVPDLVLLPERFVGRPTVRFGAGLELRFLHRGMNLMAGLARRGWVQDWSRHAALLKRAADLFRLLGSDAGAMHVTVSGTTPQGQPRRRTWQLLATEGDGPFVPTLAAAALLHRLQQAHAGGTRVAELEGARPCLGLLGLGDFEQAATGLRIRMGEVAA